MLPDLTAVNRAYWTGGADGQLLIQWCEPCARWNHPPSAQCPECDGPLDARPVSGRGTVFTSTINVHPYSPDVPTPYVIALVQLDEQDDLRLVTNIVHCEPTDVAIGMSVQVLFEQHGEIFVPLFELALQ
ncbi:MAG: putative nucleic-acid-binding protein containing a Zn-ribbon [Acidimicrobiia bacterium]|nr:putative nucleic-acid-binding protein containing a Zn-ribbon [Acidimicrobiia bacterium]